MGLSADMTGASPIPLGVPLEPMSTCKPMCYAGQFWTGELPAGGGYVVSVLMV